MIGHRRYYVRVGEALTKSKKSCACATADDSSFEAIPRGAETEYERVKTLCSFWQLRNEIADGRTIIEIWERLDVFTCALFSRLVAMSQMGRHMAELSGSLPSSQSRQPC
jgi:hypothetical protein